MVNKASSSENYRRLGYRTFCIFVLERSSAAALVLLVSLGLFLLDRSGALARIFSEPGGGPNNIYIHLVVAYLGAASLFGFLLSILLFCLALVMGWLIYLNYEFLLDDDSLRIRRGILNKEEISIPYRQIQDVDIGRDLFYRILGLSRLVILTAGKEEGKEVKGGGAEGILPAIDKDAAQQIQEKLLKKADIEKVES